MRGSEAKRRMNAVIAQIYRRKEEMETLLNNLQQPLDWEYLSSELDHDPDLRGNFSVPINSDGFRVLGKDNKDLTAEDLFKMWLAGRQKSSINLSRALCTK